MPLLGLEHSRKGCEAQTGLATPIVKGSLFVSPALGHQLTVWSNWKSGSGSGWARGSSSGSCSIQPVLECPLRVRSGHLAHEV